MQAFVGSELVVWLMTYTVDDVFLVLGVIRLQLRCRISVTDNPAWLLAAWVPLTGKCVNDRIISLRCFFLHNFCLSVVSSSW